MPVQCSQMSEAVIFLVLDVRCAIQVAYCNNHNPTSLSSPGGGGGRHLPSYILSVTIINSPRNQFVGQINNTCLGRLAAPQKPVVPTTNQPTNHGGFLQPFRGGLHRHPQSVRRGEQKVFLHVRFLFPPVPLPRPLS